MPRRICVVTGSRAEYGLLRGLLRALADDPGFELHLVATGMHLAPEFGMTCREIESDGFVIDDRVDMLLAGDSAAAIAKSIGLGTIGFADVFARRRPDLLVLLGDRFEILAAAQAALVARISIAHIHGGELTEGAFDDAIRHALSKMSGLHFVAAEAYRARVIQMGEAPERVHTVGALGLDNIRLAPPVPRARLGQELGQRLDAPLFLVTYHPATLQADDPTRAMRALLDALDAFPEACVVMTYPNADTHGRDLIPMIEDYARARLGRIGAHASLGQRRYLAVMRAASVVIGNSSSGLIEAPACGVPTVNLGTRQAGRLRAASVLDCAEERDAIVAAVRRALDLGFRAGLEGMSTPYGDGHAVERILAVLRGVDFSALIHKRFHDLPAGAP